jgi:hypothetical protein
MLAPSNITLELVQFALQACVYQNLVIVVTPLIIVARAAKVVHVTVALVLQECVYHNMVFVVLLMPTVV